MQLLRYLALAFWLFGFVKCASHDEVKAATGQIELQRANPTEEPSLAFWHKAIPAPKNPMEFTDLYTEASKEFNWLRTQPNALTKETKSALVAAFYDHRTQKKDGGKSKAPLWYKFRNKLDKQSDAENGAYYYREETGPPVSDRTYGDPRTGKPTGSKIAVWGVKGGNEQTLRTESGKALPLCDKCKSLSYFLGVEFVGAKMQEYRPPVPETKQPASAPPKKSDDRPASPAPGTKERPASPNPQAKGNPATPPPKPAGDKAPSSGSSFGGEAIDKAWNKEEEERMRQREGSKKRPPTQSPEDSGKHKPPGPTTPSALVHRPADGNKSPTPGPAPRRRSLARQRRRSTSRLNSHAPGLTHRSPGRLRRRSPKKLGRPSFGRFARRSPERVYRDSVRQLSRHHST